MIYGSQDMEHDKMWILLFWTIFCPYPPNNLENQNFEKIKKYLNLLSFYTRVP